MPKRVAPLYRRAAIGYISFHGLGGMSGSKLLSTSKGFPRGNSPGNRSHPRGSQRTH